MSKEITISGTITLVNPVAGTNDKFSPGSISVDQAGKNYISGTMGLTTAYAQVPLGSIGTAGEMMFENLDATNNVIMKGGAGGSDTITILPGKTAGPFRFVAGSPPYAKSSASTVQLAYFITEA